LVNQPELPRRFISGADAVGMVEQKIALLQQQIDAYRDLSSSLAFDAEFLDGGMPHIAMKNY
ncbi:hypothetical protein ACC745_39320, partial [Rhizobium ruizarguesonis]